MKINKIIFYLLLFTFFLLLGIYSSFKSVRLPKPEGHFNIGTTTIYWQDDSRKEPRNNILEHPFREIAVTFYYPAQTSMQKMPKRYAQKSIALLWEHLLHVYNLDYALFKNLDLLHIYTNSYEDVPFAQHEGGMKFPLILFSHGLTASPDGYTFYYEDLASKGFVVAALHHTYACDCVWFPDGRNAFNTINFNGVSYQEKDAIRTREQHTWQEDVLFVLDRLVALNHKEGWFLAETLDFSKVGTAGHSFGGSTAIQVARHDKRIKAAVNLDGGLFGDRYLEPFATPLLCITNDEGSDNASDEQIKVRGYSSRAEWQHAQLRIGQEGIDQLFNEMRADAYQVCITHSKHGTFSDIAQYGKLFFWMPWFFDCGSLQEQAHTVSRELMAAFFDKYLNRKEHQLFSDYYSGFTIKKVRILK